MGCGYEGNGDRAVVATVVFVEEATRQWQWKPPWCRRILTRLFFASPLFSLLIRVITTTTGDTHLKKPTVFSTLKFLI